MIVHRWQLWRILMLKVHRNRILSTMIKRQNLWISFQNIWTRKEKYWRCAKRNFSIIVKIILSSRITLKPMVKNIQNLIKDLLWSWVMESCNSFGELIPSQWETINGYDGESTKIKVKLCLARKTYLILFKKRWSNLKIS